MCSFYLFFFSSRRRHTRCSRDWSSDVCSSDLTKSLAVELAPRRINVNCVAPGWVDTEMSATPYARDAGRGKEDIERTIPLGRVASPEDCAGPIVFLCSDLAGHITGEILNVNGGSVLCG